MEEKELLRKFIGMAVDDHHLAFFSNRLLQILEEEALNYPRVYSNVDYTISK